MHLNGSRKVHHWSCQDKVRHVLRILGCIFEADDRPEAVPDKRHLLDAQLPPDLLKVIHHQRERVFLFPVLLGSTAAPLI